MYNYLWILLISIVLCVSTSCSQNNSPPKFNYGDVVTVDAITGIITDIPRTWAGPYYEVMFASGQKNTYKDTEIKFFTNFPWDVTDKDKTADLLKNFDKLGIPGMTMPKMGPAT